MLDDWRCERCQERGLAFNDNGEYLCADCLEDWALNEAGYDEFEIHPDPRES